MRLKKFLSVIMTAALLAAVLPIGSFQAGAWKSEYYTYTVSNGKATITYVDESINGDITIPSEIRGYPVIAIGKYAFEYCTGLTSVIIGNSVNSISGHAFYNCTGLTSVTIGNSVTSIGEHAFFNCTGLTSVIIGNSVNSISGHAFYNCTGLTSVTIGNSVTSIGEHAFQGCARLTSITIPDSVTSIGQYAFCGCTGLTSVIIGNSVNSIGEYAFEYCTGLTSIIIPDSVTAIGNYAFEHCTGLKSVTIPDSVTSIGQYAFYGCTGLTSVIIGNSVNSIGKYAFCNCTGLESIIVNDGNTVYHSENNCLIETESKTLVLGCKNSIIPADGSVTSIGDNAFKYCTGLTSITIPDSVTSIGQYAFYGCTGLTSVIIGNSVNSIGKYAFCNCTGLTSITIPDSVTSIGQHAFDHCTGLTSVIIGNSVTSIIDCAFNGCSGLKSVTIPDSVTSIGSYAFEGCTGLTSVIIGNSVNSIDKYAFYNCTGLESIIVNDGNTVYHSENNCLIKTEYKRLVLGCKNSIIPADGSVTSIGGYAFDHCTGLTSIIIPDSVTSIESCAFNGCSGLKSVTIPDSVTSIYDNAIPEKINIYGFTGSEAERYAKKTGSNFITIAAKCGDSAYYGIKANALHITGIGAVENYKTQGSVPWYDSAEQIEKIIIDDNVTKIGTYGFYCLNNLQSIICKNKDLEFGKYALNTENENITVYAKGGTLAEYCQNNNISFTDVNATPELDSFTANRITVKAVDGYEYSKNANSWQTSGVFNNLLPGTEYNIYARNAKLKTYFPGEISEPLTVTTDKATVSAPPKPVNIRNTDTEITLQPNAAYEYSIDGVNWQKSNIFTGLIHKNTYTFYQRVAETETKYASPPSEPLVIELVKKTVSAPDAPGYKSHTENSITLNANELYEYSIDGENWQKSNVFTGLQKNTVYCFYQRLAETEIEYATEASKPLITAIPDKPRILRTTGETITVKRVEGFEYCLDDFVWQDSTTFSMLLEDTDYSVYQRLKAVDGEKTHQITSEATTVITQNNFSYTPGDINGDEKVNNKDLTRLFQHLSKWDVEVNEAALDINGDGKVNNKDLTRLFQYLSKWDVEIF